MLNRYILIFAFLAFSISGFSQSPWVDAKGSVYAQFSASFISYNTIFDSNGDGAESPFDVSDRTFSLYGSYSVGNKTAILLSLPFKSVTADGESLSNLGDINIKVKQTLLDNFPLAVFAGYTAPTSEREGALRTGYNQHALDVGLSSGFSKDKVYGYAAAGFKYREHIPNQIIIDAEIGTDGNFGKTKLYFIFHVDGALNLEETEDEEADQSVLYHNNGQYLSPGIKFSLNALGNWWINFGTYGAFTATNQGASPSVSIGIAYNKKN